jgi:hypothetical protein
MYAPSRLVEAWPEVLDSQRQKYIPDGKEPAKKAWVAPRPVSSPTVIVMARLFCERKDRYNLRSHRDSAPC